MPRGGLYKTNLNGENDMHFFYKEFYEKPYFTLQGDMKYK